MCVTYSSQELASELCIRAMAMDVSCGDERFHDEQCQTGMGCFEASDDKTVTGDRILQVVL